MPGFQITARETSLVSSDIPTTMPLSFTSYGRLCPAPRFPSGSIRLWWLSLMRDCQSSCSSRRHISPRPSHSCSLRSPRFPHPRWCRDRRSCRHARGPHDSDGCSGRHVSQKSKYPATSPKSLIPFAPPIPRPGPARIRKLVSFLRRRHAGHCCHQQTSLRSHQRR